MSNRFVGLFFVLSMLVGGAAACGDDGDDGGGGDGGGADTTSVDSGGSDVEAYCADVTAFARSARIINEEVASGVVYEPEDLANLAARGEELATTASDLSADGDLSTEDAEALTECSQQASDALASVADIPAQG